MVTKKTWVTARQLAEMPDDGYLYELVRGESGKWRQVSKNTVWFRRTWPKR